MGIGVQGLANVFMMMNMEYGDEASRLLNTQIFETMYYAAITESCRMAQELGKTYETFPGSPASRGILQFDFWKNDEFLNSWLPHRLDGTMPSVFKSDFHKSLCQQRYNWPQVRPLATLVYSPYFIQVREDVKKHGLMNSLLIALMPTATTSQILGNSESFEPMTSNVYVRRTHAGNISRFLSIYYRYSNRRFPLCEPSLGGTIKAREIMDGRHA
jgi:ribonucleotide reductase alpha subunit